MRREHLAERALHGADLEEQQHEQRDGEEGGESEPRAGTGAELAQFMAELDAERSHRPRAPHIHSRMACRSWMNGSIARRSSAVASWEIGGDAAQHEELELRPVDLLVFEPQHAPRRRNLFVEERAPRFGRSGTGRGEQDLDAAGHGAGEELLDAQPRQNRGWPARIRRVSNTRPRSTGRNLTNCVGKRHGKSVRVGGADRSPAARPARSPQSVRSTGRRRWPIPRQSRCRATRERLFSGQSQDAPLRVGAACPPAGSLFGELPQPLAGHVEDTLGNEEGFCGTRICQFDHARGVVGLRRERRGTGQQGFAFERHRDLKRATGQIRSSRSPWLARRLCQTRSAGTH